MARTTSADVIWRGINSLINEEGSYLAALITAGSLDLAQSKKTDAARVALSAK
jgi:hypothetical protein